MSFVGSVTSLRAGVSARGATATTRVRVSPVCAQETRREKRIARHQRLRLKVSGTEERPRLAVFKSNQHMHAQIINDATGTTLAHSTTLMAEVKDQLDDYRHATKTAAAAALVGKALAKQALEKGVSKVVFDTGGNAYQGRVQALAEAAREEGLEF
mmetsp:Transcript_17973/g.58676  ORF Transcript_17973/g.58676 Transcript_17973/m.58676 type:complete len:156 (+) Transcript_17973:27-494(+)